MSENTPNPPLSSASQNQPQDTLLQSGAFDPPFTPGTLGRLNRFEIIRLLGEGGMGQVYLAREPLTDTTVAVKIMKPQMAADPQSVHRFLIEARHMYRLSHPRILRVLEVSDRKEGPYYVMPYIAGGSLLAQYKPGEPMPDERILSIARQVAEALAHAHTCGLIHRDLKPANVLLDKDGNAFLTDFGLVRTVFNDSMVDATASHLEGTAPYMSPAVARGEAEDTRCDIYAFGAVLYELLTAQPPYTGRTPQMILDQILRGPPLPIRQVNPKANPALAKIAERCMARELRDRYASMADVVTDLASAAQGKAPRDQRGQSSRLPKIAAMLVGALAVVGLVALGISKLSGNNPVAGVADPGQPPSPTAATAEKQVAATAQDQFTYTTNNDAITITAYTGSDASMTIPGMIAGRPVTRIADQAFKSCVALTNVAIPPSVTFLGKEAFAGCTNLASVHFEGHAPGGGSYSSLFEGANNATVYYAPGTKGWTATYGGLPAFLLEDGFECTSTSNAVTITKYAGPGGDVIIPSKINDFPVTVIGVRAFENCSKLTSVMIPNSITSIASYAFLDCTGLTNVVIPASVTALDSISFENCFGVLSISVDAANPAYSSSADGVLFNKDKTTLVLYPLAKSGSYVVPNSVTRIGGCAFLRNTELTNITIPDSVTCIGFGALWGCDGLTSVTIPNSVTNIDPFAFNRCNGLTSMTIPSNVISIGEKAFRLCPNLTGVYFRGNAPSLGSRAFEATDKATVYYLPGTTGWDKDFGGRPTAVWEDAAEALPEGPFTYTATNGAITITKYTGPGGDVTIPSAINGLPVTTIEETAFRACAKLGSVTIPSSVTKVADWAFWGCPNLTSATIAAQSIGTGRSAFQECRNLTSVTISNGVTAIGYWAFGFDERLTNIYIPASVTYVCANPFHSCTQLKSITVDEANPYYSSKDGVVFNKEQTKLICFPGGKSGSYAVPSGVTQIGGEAFWNNTLLTSITFPNSLTNIEGGAFDQCAGLTNNIIIPASVTTLGGRFILACSGVNAVVVDPENPSYSSSADGVLFDKEKTRLVAYPGGKAGAYAISDGVTKIGESAFRDCTYLTSVTIPGSVTTIDSGAFEACYNLTRIYFKGNVPRLGKDVFKGADKVTIFYRPGTTGWGKEFAGRPTAVWEDAVAAAESPAPAATDPYQFSCVASNGAVAIVRYTGEGGEVNIPAAISGLPVTSIKNEAFLNCSNVTSVIIPNSVTSIGWAAFRNCAGLTKFTIPNSVTNIGDDAFMGCSKLSRITIPASVLNVGWTSFADCGDLVSILVDPLNPNYSSSADGILFNKDKTRLLCYPSGKTGSYAIPNSVTSIGDWSFRDCANLTGITIPNGVTRIDVSAFWNCSSLTNVTLPASVSVIHPNLFGFCGRLNSITVDPANPTLRSSEDGVVFDKYQLIRYPSGKTGNYVIPTNVTRIAYCAFEGSVGLTGVTIPGGVKVLEGSAFKSCTNLTRVTISNGVTLINREAFNGCSSLSSVAIPTGVVSIGDAAFRDCTSLASVEIPAGVRSIGDSAFRGCTRLTTATIPDSVTSIEGSTFQDCISLSSVTIPDGVTKIGGWTFGSCTSLTTVTIPDSVTDIAANAFEFCTNLTSVTLGSGITNAERGAFYSCTRLTNVTIRNGVTSLGWDMFKNCTGLKTVTVPDSVTLLKRWAFVGCSNLTSVTLGSGVTQVENGVFESCGSLTGVYFKGNAPGGASDGSIFAGANNATIYYRPGATGWGPTFGGRPTAVWADGAAAPSTATSILTPEMTAESARTDAPARVYNLEISNFEDSFAFRGCPQGTYSLHGRTITVNVARWDIRFGGHDAGARQLDHLQFGLAHRSETNGWRIIRYGSTNVVNMLINSGHDATLTNLTFSVPFESAEELHNSWLVAIYVAGKGWCYGQNRTYIGSTRQTYWPNDLDRHSSASSTAPSAPSKALQVGGPAPPLAQGKYVQGEPVATFETGKVYVVEFWATWCGPCRSAIPHLNQLHEKYKDQGLVVIGQNVWERGSGIETSVTAFVARMGTNMTYRVAFDDVDGGTGKMAETWMKAAGRNGIPSAFVVDQAGKIAWIGHPSGLDEVVEKVLAGTYEIAKGQTGLPTNAVSDQGPNDNLIELAKLMAAKPQEPTLPDEGLLAQFPLRDGFADTSGAHAIFQAKQTEFAGGALYLNGIYANNGSRQGYSASAQVPNLSFSNLAIALQFWPIGLRGSDVIFMCGHSYRWLGVVVKGGVLTLSFNNGRQMFPLGIRVAPRQWHSLVCSVDLEQKRAMVSCDGVRCPDIQLPADFKFDVIGTTYEYSEKEVGFTDYSWGGVFHGFVADLRIYARALEPQEMPGRQQGAAASAANPASYGAEKSLSYEERRQRRILETQQQAAEPPPAPLYTGAELQKHLEAYQEQVIRDGLPPLPLPLHPESEKRLIEEGVLPPK